jgi:arylsulfatase A-like enzyme
MPINVQFLKNNTMQFIAGLSLILSPHAFSQDTRPNILYIMADDHAVEAIGAYATHLKGYVDTPNIDALAKQGALFTNVHAVNALCAPSRATIITGLYSHKHGVYTLREELDTSKHKSVAQVLQNDGYQTAVIGKWHVPGDNLHGYDYFAITHSQGSYQNPTLNATGNKKVKLKGYVSDAYTDHQIDWLNQRDKNKPFFLMAHHKAVHGPWEYPKRHEDLYKDITIPEPETLFDDYKGRVDGGVNATQSRIHQADSKGSLSLWLSTNKKGKKGVWATGQLDIKGKTDEEITKATYQKYMKDYLRAVKGVDDNVGRLIEYLKAEGILENTIVIYTSDQGMYLGEHGFFDKRLGLNPAVQMPFVVRYPQSIKAGTVVDEMVNNVDFAETLISMGEAEVPAEMQGYSFWDLAQGKAAKWPREQTVYTWYSSSVTKHYGIINKDYRLLKYFNKKGDALGIDLYHRHNDKAEINNLANNPEYAEIVTKLEKNLAEEAKSIGLTQDLMPSSTTLKFSKISKSSKH